MRLIDADELEMINNWTFAKPPFSRKTVQKMIDMARTIDAVPVRHGKWIHDGYDHPHGIDWIHCSECGKRDVNCPASITNYCPNCGARMDADATD